VSSALSPLLGPHGVFGLAARIFKSDSFPILRIIRYSVDAAATYHTLYLYLYLYLYGCLCGRIR
jgi:hypothetical protein